MKFIVLSYLVLLLTAGNYSSLTLYFELEREFGHYIMDYYVPSIMLVTVSWVSFWLDPNAVPGRTTLGKKILILFNNVYFLAYYLFLLIYDIYI